MPRKNKGPRLYLDPKRRAWVIRDGVHFIRTGCPEGDVDGARKLLGEYLSKNYRPKRSTSPPLVDVLLVYMREVVPHKRTARNLRYNVAALERWWGDKTIADVTAANCRAYAASKGNYGALQDLKKLQSAINYWHREYGPLDYVPKVTLPKAPAPRTRWLTRSEAARLLKVARKTQYLARFILLGLHTGSRPGVALALKWSQIDFTNKIMHRRPQMAQDAGNKRAPPVRLGRKILAHLRRWQRLDRGLMEYVVSYEGRRIDSPHASWKRVVKEAGLPGKVTPHTLRHTRATWLMQRGADLWQAAGHLGMTTKTLEVVYGHHHPEYQADVADL